MVNYYETLEITRAATDADVKKAYKKLALKWHPDKNADNNVEATNRFKQISEAYQVLSDEKQRKLYDQKLNREARHRTATSRTHSHHQTNRHMRTANTPPFDFSFHFKSADEIFREFFKNDSRHFDYLNNPFGFNTRSSRFGQNIVGESRRQAAAAAANGKEPRNFMSFMFDPFTDISPSKRTDMKTKKSVYSVTSFTNGGKSVTKKIVLENNIETTYQYENNELIKKTTKTLQVAKQ